MIGKRVIFIFIPLLFSLLQNQYNNYCYCHNTQNTENFLYHPGEGNGSPFQYFCLGNPTGREAWWATVRGFTKSQTQLSN